MLESDFNKYRQDESTESFQKEVIEYLQKMLDNIEVINNNTTASHEAAKQYDTHIQKMFKMYFAQSNTNIEIINKKQPTQTVQKEIPPKKIELNRRSSTRNEHGDKINYSDLRSKLQDIRPSVIDRLAAHTYNGSGSILSKMISGSKSLLSNTLFNPNDRRESRRLLGISNEKTDTSYSGIIIKPKSKESNIELSRDGSGDRNISKETQESIELAEKQELNRISSEQHKSLIEQLVTLNNKAELTNTILKGLSGKLSDIDISTQANNPSVLGDILSNSFTKLGPVLIGAMKSSLPILVGAAIAYATGKATVSVIDKVSETNDARRERDKTLSQEEIQDKAYDTSQAMIRIKKEGQVDENFVKALGADGDIEAFRKLTPEQQKNVISYKTHEFDLNAYNAQYEVGTASINQEKLQRFAQNKKNAVRVVEIYMEEKFPSEDKLSKDKKTLLREKLIATGVIAKEKYEKGMFGEGKESFMYKNEQALIDNFTEDELGSIPGLNIMENKDQDSLLSSAAAEHRNKKAIKNANKEQELQKIEEQKTSSSYNNKTNMLPAIPQTDMTPVTDLLKSVLKTLQHIDSKEPIQVTYPIPNTNSNTIVPIHRR